MELGWVWLLCDLQLRKAFLGPCLWTHVKARHCAAINNMKGKIRLVTASWAAGYQMLADFVKDTTLPLKIVDKSLK